MKERSTNVSRFPSASHRPIRNVGPSNSPEQTSSCSKPSELRATYIAKQSRPNELPEIGFVRLPVVLRHIPISRSLFLAKVKSGEFPKPVHLSVRIVAWDVQDIRALISGMKGQHNG